MRWDNLRIEAEEGATLPGYSDPAQVRTFDAPEAMDTRFYEVRAKSALNRVPEASRMFFRWTINPYRGCAHACSYCAVPETPILMADGRTKAIGDLRAGDEIYGTRREGAYRRYTRTSVLDHWRTRKPAYRTTLEDGTEFITSGDHRFLTERGWKHVADLKARQRPHLTTNNKLMGVGGLAVGPHHGDEYRRGYLTGMIRGDGTLGSYRYARGDVHRFRLALNDFEALRRSREYLSGRGVATDEFAFLTAPERHRPMRAIRTQARAPVAAIRSLIEWPGRASHDWCQGFLAGIFDAEGSYSRGILRISNTDAAMLDWTAWCMRRLRLSFSVEDPGRPNGLRCIRLLGGLREHLRFFLTVDPAITRKRTIDGVAIKSNAPLKVVSVEPLFKELELVDITTGTGDFISNGVVSHNCFARPTHKYLGFNAGRDFDREIVVKVNVPEVLRADLRKPSWKREHVALGTNTDPYQWVEGRYELMRGIWQALLDHRTPCSILTKSPLVLRDLDLLEQLRDGPGVSANFSIPTLDEKTWRSTEPRTPNPKARLEALAELNRRGIPTGVLVAPLMPGVNDSPAQVEKIVELANAAGATSIGGIALHLRGDVKGIFMDWLREKRPDLVPMYEEYYARGAYAPKAIRDELSRRVGNARGRLAPRRDPAPTWGDPKPELEPEVVPAAEQKSLF